MNRDAKFLFKLFRSTFYLSAFTFGGGYVIVPLMRKRFVEQYGWIEEQEMLDMIAIAQSSPGPIAVNTSIIVGYRLAGVIGALVTVLGTVTPPLIIITLISMGYAAFRDNRIVNLVLLGMQAGVAAVITSVVITMAAAVVKQKRALPVALMVLVFIAAAFFKVNVVIILLACACIGLIDTLVQQRRAAQAKEGTL
jgi:chromate transporter